MPAVSKAQQAFMAVAEHAPEKLRVTAPNMSKAQLHDFAATPTKGLPSRAKPPSKSPAKRMPPPLDARSQRIKNFEAANGDKELP